MSGEAPKSARANLAAADLEQVVSLKQANVLEISAPAERRDAPAEAHPARRIQAHAAFQRPARMPAVRVQDGGRGMKRKKPEA